MVLTQGDPEGIGLDLLLRAAKEGLLCEGDKVVASTELLSRRAQKIGQEWAQNAFMRIKPWLVDENPSGPCMGQFAALRKGVDLVLQSPAALVTAPIDKKIAAQEGLPTPGHTEYLAQRCGVDTVAMLMAGPKLRVALATIHVPLAQVSAKLSAELVRARTLLLIEGLRELFGVERPRVGILGLNPHAGEGGRLGREELDILEPLLPKMSRELEGRAEVLGPVSADTAFYWQCEGRFDGLLAMYHDQGLGPFKLLHFHDGVNVTLGLPFLRTSPDHGTARDKAGSAAVDPRSFFAAIELARQGKWSALP